MLDMDDLMFLQRFDHVVNNVKIKTKCLFFSDTISKDHDGCCDNDAGREICESLNSSFD